MKLKLGSENNLINDYLANWDFDNYTYRIVKYMYKKHSFNGTMTISDFIHRKDMPLWLKPIIKREKYDIIYDTDDVYSAVIYLYENGYVTVMNEGNDGNIDIKNVHEWDMIIELTTKGKVVVESRERELRRWAIPTSLSIIALLLGVVNLVIKLLE